MWKTILIMFYQQVSVPKSLRGIDHKLRSAIPLPLCASIPKTHSVQKSSQGTAPPAVTISLDGYDISTLTDACAMVHMQYDKNWKP